jgi:FkbM family methyltransferase
MKVSQFTKNLRLIDRNLAWLKSDLPASQKFFYYIHIFTSYLGLIGGKKSINYLGNNFLFDNPATPLNLQYYPREIKQKIIDNLATTPKHILDIGGNIGHFCVTANYYLPAAKIDIFEPNPEVFETLEKNIAGRKNLRAFNLAITPDKSSSFFFEPNRSGTGSFIAENATDNKNKLTKITVQGTSQVSGVTGRSRYDLIKVDVEGYEYEVIKLLKDLKTAYLFIELSGSGRTKNYEHSELFALIKEQLGDFDIIYSTETSAQSITVDLLLSFK